MLYREYVKNRKQYQELGTSLLLDKKHACLFFSPGKGKTYPVIDAMLEVDKMKNYSAEILIISTAGCLKNMWYIDIVPQNILPSGVHFISSMKAISENMQKELLKRKWDLIVVDECHLLKAHNSKIHRLVHKLSMKTEYVWGMSGTPRGNIDLDIWCQLRALNVANQGKFVYSKWAKSFCKVNTGYGAGGRQFVSYTDIKDEFRPYWEDMLVEHCLFVDYDEDDNMPDLDIEVIELPYEKREEYILAERNIIKIDDFATTTQKQIAILKAHQICNGYIYTPEKEVYRFNRNPKLDESRKYVEKYGKSVIIYRFIEDFEAIMKEYGDRATTSVAEFKKGKHDILVMQFGSAQSFNLQDYADLILLYTHDYSFLSFKQMIHRLWRMGRTKPVKVLVLQHKNTVEKQIWNAVKNKQNAHELVMSIKKEYEQ